MFGLGKKKIRIVTHGGKFHVDDVFAVATLWLKFGKDNCEVIRVHHQHTIPEADYVVDTGRIYNPEQGKFDHHQNDSNLVRENGIPYASFGLVWKTFGFDLTGSQSIVDSIDERMVQPIDAADNGVSSGKESENGLFPYMIYNVIVGFRPTWKDDKTDEAYDKRFNEVTTLAFGILEREIYRSSAWEEGRQVVGQCYHKSDRKDLIVVDIDHDIERELVTSALQEFEDVQMVVRRAGIIIDHKWQAVSPNKDQHSFELRTPFPKPWRGLEGKELQDISEVKDAVFCHKSGFMAVAESKEGALELAEKALAYTQEHE